MGGCGNIGSLVLSAFLCARHRKGAGSKKTGGQKKEWELRARAARAGEASSWVILPALKGLFSHFSSSGVRCTLPLMMKCGLFQGPPPPCCLPLVGP